MRRVGIGRRRQVLVSCGGELELASVRWACVVGFFFFLFCVCDNFSFG